MKNIPTFLIIATALCGCVNAKINTHLTANTHYVQPEEKTDHGNSIIVDASFDKVWKNLIHNIGKNTFEIDRWYKSSGLIVIEYNGDPERYIKCGTITYRTRRNDSENIFEFPAEKTIQEYEYARDNQLVKVTKKMSLNAKSNIVLEEIEAGRIRITVTSSYLVKSAVVQRDARGARILRSLESSFFNTGETGYLINDEQNVTCRSTGKLENDILSFAR